jgi:hypothetical protein
MNLSKTLAAWGSPEFEPLLKQEIAQLDRALLPLQQGLSAGGHVIEDGMEVMIIRVNESENLISAKVGIFYRSVIAGCSCADDPTPVDENSEYCELLVEIDGGTGEATVSLVTV